MLCLAGAAVSVYGRHRRQNLVLLSLGATPFDRRAIKLTTVAAYGAAGGFVVTSSRFTDEAKAFASDRNVELVDGSRLFEMIKQAQTYQISSRSLPMRTQTRNRHTRCAASKWCTALRSAAARRGINFGAAVAILLVEAHGRLGETVI